MTEAWARVFLEVLFIQMSPLYLRASMQMRAGTHLWKACPGQEEKSTTWYIHVQGLFCGASNSFKGTIKYEGDIFSPLNTCFFAVWFHVRMNRMSISLHTVRMFCSVSLCSPQASFSLGTSSCIRWLLGTLRQLHQTLHLSLKGP